MRPEFTVSWPRGGRGSGAEEVSLARSSEAEQPDADRPRPPIFPPLSAVEWKIAHERCIEPWIRYTCSKAARRAGVHPGQLFQWLRHFSLYARAGDDVWGRDIIYFVAFKRRHVDDLSASRHPRYEDWRAMPSSTGDLNTIREVQKASFTQWAQPANLRTPAERAKAFIFEHDISPEKDYRIDEFRSWFGVERSTVSSWARRHDLKLTKISGRGTFIRGEDAIAFVRRRYGSRRAL